MFNPRQRFLTNLLIPVFLFIASLNVLHASGNSTYQCATSGDVYKALEKVEPGDTIMLEGGSVYELDKTLMLRASGTETNRINFTSQDITGQGRYAVITTVGQKKEEDLVAIRLRGSFWSISRIEIAGKRVPLGEDYWDTKGFRIGLYLEGLESHHNVVEDVHIHHTHNTAVAVRNQSHHNTFRRMKIHHIGEWLDADYNAHEGEGFYLGSSKGFDEKAYNAKISDILIEDSVLGPGLLGQFIDIKYAASNITARNNILYCGEKSYNDEVVSMSGYANLIEGNKFVGSSEGRTRYIRVFNKKTKVPVSVDYQGQKNIPSPTGRDNKVINNMFFTDDPEMLVVKVELKETDRSTLIIENNRVEPLDKF